MVVTESVARQIIGLEYCLWIDQIGLEWCLSLPYSGLPGWTNGQFSIIYGESGTETLHIAKGRYMVCFNEQNGEE